MTDATAGSADQRNTARFYRIDPAKQVDDLILLVGTNPLPNYVAAQLQLAAGGRLWLIHTAETQTLATRLKDNLAVPATLRQTQPRHASSVRHTVRPVIAEIQNQTPQGRIGLNYTGGTAVMAVNAYWVVRQCVPFPVLSYLDAAQLRLRIESVDDGEDWDEDVALESSPRLSTLLGLHGWQETSSKKEPILARSAAALAKVYGRLVTHGKDKPKSLGSHWEQWVKDKVKSQWCDARGNWKRAADPTPIPWPACDGLGAVVDTLSTELPGASPDALDFADAAKHGPFTGKHKLKNLGQWLEGTWLESLVLETVQALAPGWRFHDACMGLDISFPGSNDVGASTKSEIDVVAVRGYQLFVFSCTASCTRSDQKHRLFEASVRARQLGGDEARTALVCPALDPQGLTREMTKEYALDDRKIHTFGAADLPKLGDSIAAWLEELERSRRQVR